MFFITVMKDNTQGNRFRCWGFLPDLDAAKRVVLENLSDIFECDYYDIALIEEFQPGIPAISSKTRFWYKATYVDESGDPKVEETIEPEWAERVFNFGIG